MSQRHRTESGLGFCPRQTTLRLLAVLVLFLSTGRSDGIDLTLWARHIRHHQDWTSLDFRDPFSGMFLAARAGTEDQRRNATLTLTATPAQGCKADFVIVLKADVPALRDSEEVIRIAMQIDALAPHRISARIVKPRDDPFVFVQFLDEIRPDTLKGHKTMAVIIPDAQVATTFSLKGLQSAWGTAQATCQSFAPTLFHRHRLG